MSRDRAETGIPPEARGTTVLLVEDDRDYAGIVKDYLAQKSTDAGTGFRVEHETTLSAAIQRLEQGDIHVILLDMDLPDCKGINTLLELRPHTAHLPIIILSGTDDERFILEALRQGAQEYLVKEKVNAALLTRTIQTARERQRIVTQQNDSAAQKLKSQSVQLELLACCDPLTSLLNRRGLERVLEKESARVPPENPEITIILLDLDNFKEVNDTLGHAAGDLLLKEVASKLNSCLRESDYKIRVGGDEFLVLLAESNLSLGIRIAERIRSAISDMSMTFTSSTLRITASLAVVTIPRKDLLVENLLEKTHSALYKSKISGKNRVSTQQSAEVQDKNEASIVPILEAIQSGQDILRVVRQPIFRLKNQEIVGYEFLIRTTIAGFEMPEDIFRVCIEANLLTLFDRQCFRACVCAAASSLPPALRCHVNLFPATLTETPVNDLLDESRARDPKRQYCIEISERNLVGHSDNLVRQLAALQKAAVLIALDNVGFARGCLDNLTHLNPNLIKIDPNYVRKLNQEQYHVQALGPLLKIAEAIGAQVVAEGIETQETLQLLINAGIEYGQGFLLGKPTAAGS